MSSDDIFSKLLSSTTKGDLLVLFHKNPGLVDTLDGVSRRIGRKPEAVEPDIRDLIELGVLQTKRIGRFDVVLLNKAGDEEIQASITEYLTSLKGRGVK